jgi:hypothetical protein
MQLGGMTMARSREGREGPAKAQRSAALPTAATAKGGWNGKVVACVERAEREGEGLELSLEDWVALALRWN